VTDCPHCGFKLSDSGLTSALLTDCPNCGVALPEQPNASSASNLFKQYLTDLREIITHPTAFFRRMPTTGGVGGPLAFALVTHWLGEAVSFLWRLAIGGSVGGMLDKMFRLAGDVADVDSPGRGAQLMEARNRIAQWIWGAGPVLADPFLTLASILFTSFLVYVGSRLLVTPGHEGAPRPLRFETALRIVCFGLTPSILAAIPIFGGAVSWVLIILVTTVGAREVYHVPTGRAVAIALFPKLLLLAILSSMVAFALLVVIKLVATSF
jgi:hypothetical protein